MDARRILKHALIVAFCLTTASFSVHHEATRPHLTDAQCEAQMDPEIGQDVWQYQPNCDALGNLVMLGMGFVPGALYLMWVVIIPGTARFLVWLNESKAVGRLPYGFRRLLLVVDLPRRVPDYSETPLRTWQRWGLLTIAMVGALSGFVVHSPSAVALGEPTPLLTCVTTITGDLDNVGPNFDGTIGFASVDYSGNLYLSWKHTPTTVPASGERGMISSFSTGCVQRWTLADPNCSANADSCVFGGLQADQAGRVISAERTNVASPSFTKSFAYVFDGATGATLFTSANLTSVLTPGWTRPFGAASIPNGTTDVNYLLIDLGTSRVAKFSSNLSTNFFNTAGTPTLLVPSCCDYANLTHFFDYSEVGSGANIERRNATTGALELSSSISGFRLCPEQKLNQGFASPTLLISAYCGGVNGNVTMVYLKTTISTMSVSTVAISPNQMDEGGGLTDTRLNGHDLDGSDNLLICGNYNSGGTFKPFIGKITTSNNTMGWNQTLTPPFGSGGNSAYCNFDYISGFYVVTTYTTSAGKSAIEIRHYSGGNFVAPTPRNPVVFPPPVVVVTPTPADLGNGVVNFAKGIGFTSEGSLFFFGIILVLIMMSAAGASLYATLHSANGAMMAGGFAGIATMIFNVTQSLWPAWASVVLIAATSALIGFLIKRQFGDAGGA